MFEPPSTVDTVIDRLAAEALVEIRRMTDAALVAIGIPKETVNRRRGQLNRHAKNHG